MLIEHAGKRPNVHADAWVAPTATLCGDVWVGPGARIMHGAQVIGEGGRIEIGACCIVMENAVVRSTPKAPARLGDNCLIGPCAHVVGAEIEDQVFVATGAALFHGSRIGRASVVRIHGVVHIKTVLPPRSTVPIGWVAVGDPAQILPPGAHDEIWEIQEKLNFFGKVYGVDTTRSYRMREVTEMLSARLMSHGEDRLL